MANKNLKEYKRKEKGKRVTSWICYMWVALSCMFKSHLPQGQKFKCITCHLLKSLLDSTLRECMSLKDPPLTASGLFQPQKTLIALGHTTPGSRDVIGITN